MCVDDAGIPWCLTFYASRTGTTATLCSTPMVTSCTSTSALCWAVRRGTRYVFLGFFHGKTSVSENKSCFFLFYVVFDNVVRISLTLKYTHTKPKTVFCLSISIFLSLSHPPSPVAEPLSWRCSPFGAAAVSIAFFLSIQSRCVQFKAFVAR